MLCYNRIIKRKTKQVKENKIMKRITINNGTVAKKQAIKEAKEYNEKTGNAVEVCNMIGDTILYLKKRI